jgi:hypothetical protein
MLLFCYGSKLGLCWRLDDRLSTPITKNNMHDICSYMAAVLFSFWLFTSCYRFFWLYPGAGRSPAISFRLHSTAIDDPSSDYNKLKVHYALKLAWTESFSVAK